MTILAHRLMRLIETHADALVEALEAKIASSERCTDYQRVSAAELKTLVGGVYGHLGEWLVTKTEQDIERRYTMIGTRRAEQCVSVSQLLWCMILVKENLWEYLKKDEILENTAQIFGELELMQMVDHFFDHALYYAVRGHERVREARMEARR
jgi:monoamine oxidase